MKKCRKANGLSQQALADKLFMRKSTISNYENEKIREISIITLQELAAVLGTTVSYLVEGKKWNLYI